MGMSPTLVLVLITLVIVAMGLLRSARVKSFGEGGGVTRKNLVLIGLAVLVVGAGVYVIANRDGARVSQVPDGRPVSEGE